MLGQRAGEAEHLAVLALADARRGQADEAIGSAEGALRLAAMQGLAWPAAMATWALGDLQLSRGEPEQALVRLETLWHGQRRERHPLIAVFAAPELVEAAVRAKSPGRGDVAFEQLTSWAGASGQSWAGALVERCRFLRADHPREADVAFARCLALHAEAAHPYDLARSQLAYGELLRRSRRRADSRQFLRSAVEGFENLGAVIWEQRARTEVRASGETLRQRGDHTTLDELTPQEETIARLVAQGRTNRDVAAQLFLSVRTVEFHLRNIFVKLGVTSRVELVGLGDLLPDLRREKLGDSRL
jgi:DNA-binding NarL/FixJ family response regulator